ncbi:hypothetical protein BS78_08G094800 [Paspalum vaginatum]|nr:hypothetical protein BS78_08G094800 [Paspalum vaginatum]
MVAGSFTDECVVAVSAERLWKVVSSVKSTLLPKACAGYIDAVEVEGAGGVDSVTTMKFNPAVAGEVMVVKTRIVALDDAERVMRTEVLQGGKLSAELKSQVNEVKVEAAGEGASVVKLKVEYERLDGATMAPEHQAKIAQALLGLVKKVEAYLVTHPGELA